VYLWDTNILRHYAEGHPNLALHLKRVKRAEVGLPSVVFAEAAFRSPQRGCESFPPTALQAGRRYAAAEALALRTSGHERLPPSTCGEALDPVTGSFDIFEEKSELGFAYIPEGGVPSALERLGFRLNFITRESGWNGAS
jgi:hypothetical protein